MTNIEHSFFDFLQKHILWFLLGAVTITGIFIRIFGMDYQSGDYTVFLANWWTNIETQGLKALGMQIGNYNIPYQILIYLLTLLPIGPLYSYKILSIVFDFVLACGSALLVRSFNEKKSKILCAITYSLVFCSLPVVLNSAFWAQCDSIYVSFILFAIYFLKKEKNILSFIMLGFAFAFKLQFILVLPFFLFYYASNRKISILHFLIIPAVNFIICLPTVFLGRDLFETFTIYTNQTDDGKLIHLNFPNIYAFMCNGNDINNYYLLKEFSIILTITILGIALALILYKKVDLSNNNNFLITLIWTNFTCLMFLSSMHERYSYLLDILLIIYVIVAKKRVWLAVACNLITLRGYCFYLFYYYEALNIGVTSIIYIAIYTYVTYIFVKEVIINGDKLTKSFERKKTVKNRDYLKDLVKTA